MGKWKINLKKCKKQGLSLIYRNLCLEKKGTDLVLSFFQKKFHCQIKDAIISD